MNVASHSVPNFPTIPSTLSNADRNFVEFTRCLYKAKLIVQELEEFSQTILPAFEISPFTHKQHHDTEELIKYTSQCLDESYNKFRHMCHVLLIVLTKLESDQAVRHERISSFRQEVLVEWQKVVKIRQNLISLMQSKVPYHLSKLPSPISDSSPTTSSTMSETDDEMDSESDEQ